MPPRSQPGLGGAHEDAAALLAAQHLIGRGGREPADVHRVELELAAPTAAGPQLRCADAAGADAVVLTDSSVDIYNPKVVRSTAGSLFHLPVVVGVPFVDALAGLRAAGCRVLAADASGLTTLGDPALDLTDAHAWVMGNEAWGLPEALREACDEVVRVPIHGMAESLNLAMAATVCLYTSATALARV